MKKNTDWKDRIHQDVFNLYNKERSIKALVVLQYDDKDEGVLLNILQDKKIEIVELFKEFNNIVVRLFFSDLLDILSSSQSVKAYSGERKLHPLK